MKNNIKTILLFVLISIGGYAQTTYTPNFNPPTAEAFKFTKVGEIPVNESSGNASLDIPLYVFEAGKIKLPISMSHSGGAVAVDEDNSWTGIGWQLSTGGLITRTVNDKPDEKMGIDQRLHPTGSVSQQTLYTIATSTYDSEVDVFNYNFNGYSGSFYFQVELDANNKLIARQIKYDKELKIEMSLDPIVNGVTQFNKRTIIITTPDGTKYYFGGINASESTRIRQGSAGAFNEFAQVSFYLFKIENILGDIVNLSYTIDGYGTLRIIGYNQELIKDVSLDGVSNCSPSLTTNPSLSSPKPYYLETTGYLRLNTITSNIDSSKIEFESSSSTYTQIVGYILNSIKIYDYKNTLFKKIKLNYVSPAVVGSSSNIPTTVSNLSYRRFFLDNIQVFQGSNILTDEVYSFEYNNYNLLPKRFSYSQDYAGYYNGALSNTCYIPNVPSYIDAPLLTLANRNVTLSNHAQYGSLVKIIYPTKGYIQIEYESGNSNLVAFPLHTSTTTVYKKPGIRIKRISAYDNNGTINVTRYYYTVAANALSASSTDSEEQVRMPNFLGTLRVVGACVDDSYCYPYTIEKKVIYSKPQNTIYMSDFNRNNYRYVTVSYGGDNFENGGKQSEYFVQADIPVSPVGNGVGYVTENKASNNSLKNGTLLNEIIFKNGASFNTSTNEITSGKLRETTNVYEIISEKSHSINNWYASKFCATPNCISGNYSYFTDNYYIGQYLVFSWWHNLKSTTVKEYLNNEIVETTQDYFYENAKLAGLPSRIVQNTGADNIETKNYYPPDDNMASEPFRNLLITSYIIDTPLKTEIFKNSTKISEQRTIFGNDATTGNKLLPKFIYAAKFPNSLPTTAYGNIEKKVTYTYDSKGNIIEYQLEDNIPVSIIWGYNKTKVVAKLENIQYNNIPSTLKTDIENVTNSATSSEVQILTALNALRTSSDTNMQNALITTISYNSLIGVSSVTDPKGDKVTYHYDDFNRLQYVKDKDGNILSENQYNYKN